MGRKAITAPRAVAVAGTVKWAVEDSVRRLGSDSTTYLFRYSASTAHAALELRKLAGSIVLDPQRLPLPEFSNKDTAVWLSDTAEGLGWKPSDGAHCGYVVVTVRRGRLSVEETRAALAAGFHNAGVELTHFALDRSLDARIVYANGQALRQSGGLASKLHWVGYFVEHGSASARSSLVYAFILKQLSVRGIAAAHSHLESNPEASWEDAKAVATAAQEKHREAVRKERAKLLAAAGAPAGAAAGSSGAAAGSSRAAAAKGKGKRKGGKQQQQQQPEEEEEEDDDEDDEDAEDKERRGDEGAAAGAAAGGGWSRTSAFDWTRHLGKFESWLWRGVLMAQLAVTFFARAGWGAAQSLLLGALLTDGHLFASLTGFEYTAHCGDVGFVALLVALVCGFSSSGPSKTTVHSHIHRPKGGDRLHAQYFAVRWTVRDGQMAKDLNTYMPAGERVNAFDAQYKRRCIDVVDETDTRGAFAVGAFGGDGDASNTSSRKLTDDDLLKIMDEGSKVPPAAFVYTPSLGFTSGNIYESELFSYCTHKVLLLGNHPSAAAGPKEPKPVFTGTGGVKFRLMWTGPFITHSFLKGLEREAAGWAPGVRALAVGSGPQAAAYHEYGAPWRALPDRKIYLLEHCLETGIIPPLQGYGLEVITVQLTEANNRAWFEKHDPGDGQQAVDGTYHLQVLRDPATREQWVSQVDARRFAGYGYNVDLYASMLTKSDLITRESNTALYLRLNQAANVASYLGEGEGAARTKKAVGKYAPYVRFELVLYRLVHHPLRWDIPHESDYTSVNAKSLALMPTCHGNTMSMLRTLLAADVDVQLDGLWAPNILEGSMLDVLALRKSVPPGTHLPVGASSANMVPQQKVAEEARKARKTFAQQTAKVAEQAAAAMAARAAAEPESSQAAAGAAAAADTAADLASEHSALPEQPDSRLLMQMLTIPAMMVSSTATGKRTKGRGSTIALFARNGQLGPVLLRCNSRYYSHSNEEPDVRCVTLHLRPTRLISLEVSQAGGSAGIAPWAMGAYAAASAALASQLAADVLLLDPPDAIAGAPGAADAVEAVDQAAQEALRRLAAGSRGPAGQGGAGAAAAAAGPGDGAEGAAAAVAAAGQQGAGAEGAAGAAEPGAGAAAQQGAGMVQQEVEEDSANVEASSVPPQHGCTQFQAQVVKLMVEMSGEELVQRLEQLAALPVDAEVWLMLPLECRIYLGKGVVKQTLFAAEGMNLRDRFRVLVEITEVDQQAVAAGIKWLKPADVGTRWWVAIGSDVLQREAPTLPAGSVQQQQQQQQQATASMGAPGPAPSAGGAGEAAAEPSGGIAPPAAAAAEQPPEQQPAAQAAAAAEQPAEQQLAQAAATAAAQQPGEQQPEEQQLALPAAPAAAPAAPAAAAPVPSGGQSVGAHTGAPSPQGAPLEAPPPPAAPAVGWSAAQQLLQAVPPAVEAAAAAAAGSAGVRLAPPAAATGAAGEVPMAAPAAPAAMAAAPAAEAAAETAAAAAVRKALAAAAVARKAVAAAATGAQAGQAAAAAGVEAAAAAAPRLVLRAPTAQAPAAPAVPAAPAPLAALAAAAASLRTAVSAAASLPSVLPLPSQQHQPPQRPQKRSGPSVYTLSGLQEKEIIVAEDTYTWSARRGDHLRQQSTVQQAAPAAAQQLASVGAAAQAQPPSQGAQQQQQQQRQVEVVDISDSDSDSQPMETE